MPGGAKRVTYAMAHGVARGCALPGVGLEACRLTNVHRIAHILPGASGGTDIPDSYGAHIMSRYRNGIPTDIFFLSSPSLPLPAYNHPFALKRHSPRLLARPSVPGCSVVWHKGTQWGRTKFVWGLTRKPLMRRGLPLQSLWNEW